MYYVFYIWLDLLIHLHLCSWRHWLLIFLIISFSEFGNRLGLNHKPGHKIFFPFLFSRRIYRIDSFYSLNIWKNSQWNHGLRIFYGKVFNYRLIFLHRYRTILTVISLVSVFVGKNFWGTCPLQWNYPFYLLFFKCL